MSPSSQRQLALALAGGATVLFAGVFWRLPSPAVNPPRPSKVAATALLTGQKSPVTPPSAAGQAASDGPTNPLARAMATPNLRRRARRFKRLGASLAADFDGAFEILAALENQTDREPFLRGLFGVLAGGDPVRALTAAKRLESADDKKVVLPLLADRLVGPAERDERDTAVERVSAPDASLESRLGMDLVNHWPPRPEAAALWARTFTQGEDRLTLLSYAAALQFSTDPALAESYGREFVGDQQAKFQEQFVGELASTDPEAAWRWTQTLADPTQRHHVQETALQAAAGGLAPAVAAREVAEASTGTFADNTVSLVAQMYGLKKPDDAVAWAQALPEREAAIALPVVGRTATYDMGLILGVDPEGYPFISSMAMGQNSPLIKSMHPFDRILGVSDATGALVDVRNLGLLQVADLIKGPAGSVVQLQLASKLDGGGYHAPVTVPLTRPAASSRP